MTQERTTYEIYSITGLLVKRGILEENQKELTLQNLSTGSYLLKVKGYPVVKILKQ